MRPRTVLGLALLAGCAPQQTGMAPGDLVVCRPGEPCVAQPRGMITADLRGDEPPPTSAPVRRGGRLVDPISAARGAETAAEAGVVQAQYDFALMLFRGEGVRRDPYRAIQTMRRAAEGGSVPAQRALGRVYMTGLQEMGQDPQEARTWFGLAASRGDAQARRDLAEMDRAERSERDFQRALALKMAETRVIWLRPIVVVY